MSKKVNNIEFRGNDLFFGKDKKVPNNKNIRRFFPEGKNGFGGLGNGILRPSKRPFNISLQKPYKPNKKFKPDGHLTEDQKMKRIADQIANTVQQTLDETAAKKKAENQKNSSASVKQEEKPQQKKSKMSTGVKVLFVVASILTIYTIYGFATKFEIPKTKKA